VNLVGRSTGRLLRRLLIGLIGVVAVVGTTAGPSNAAPYWQIYHKTPSWHCGSPDNLFVGNGLFEVQACVVRSGAYVQAVMTITNTSTNAKVNWKIGDVERRITATGLVASSDSCLASVLGPGQTRACFGRTLRDTRASYAHVSLWYVYGIFNMSANSPSA
jgi:hypothetical protein